jgi:hypothetical protein
MEYFDGPGAFAPGPFLLLAEHVVLKGHALWIGFSNQVSAASALAVHVLGVANLFAGIDICPDGGSQRSSVRPLKKWDGALSLRRIWHGTRFRPATPALPRFPCA